ncbi:THAP domain-containing protein 3-like [Daktulosphaira vitifoliae]|uniref:THAP domain-containing protein 3-like n=1 Tax=Daktulosphaira vitifoliae TaxID=58002 RepID=UPI0021AA436D|nr:THAP domain-containing protein 3-like [Daktulosphaira vitifoliae]
MSHYPTGMRCSVKYCSSRCSYKDKSFFSYPKESNRLKLWLANCQTNHLAEALSKKKNLIVCADHFEDKMFLNRTTKNRLVHDAVPTLFSDNIIFQRQQEIIKCVTSSPSTTEPFNSLSKSALIDQSGYESPVSSSDSITQTPLYLLANTPSKLKLKTKLHSERQKIKKMSMTIVDLVDQLSKYDTVENYIRLSKKYLSPALFTVVKSHINLKSKN